MSKNTPPPKPAGNATYGVKNEGRGLPQSTLRVPMPAVQPPKPATPSPTAKK